MTPSPQQQALYDWIDTGSGSCVLEAVAGAGKTTTLIQALGRMQGDIFFGAYNKGIAEELKARAPEKRGLDISTMHAAGFRYWRRVAPRVKVDGNKCRDIFRSASDRYPLYKMLEPPVLKLVGLAKQAGLGALKPADEANFADLIDHFDLEVPRSVEGSEQVSLAIKLARKVLMISTEQDIEKVDFDDMIYAPLFHDARVWEHDWVLIDEAQDTNATRRALALRMLKRGGRLVAVGDRHQAIYGFTGADSDALDLIGDAVSATRLPLTTTFRCPKRVVEYAQQWVSHINAADTAPEGSVTEGALKDLSKLAKPGDAVLCRFNAPLLTNVYAFIAAGIPAKVEGREIGEGLKVLARRWKVSNLAQLTKYVDDYCEAEAGKLRAKEKESKAAALEDKVACLRVIINRVMTLDPNGGPDAVCSEIDKLFGDNVTDVVVFSSIHKSKGREWHRVIWLQTGPSGWARKEWEQGQEVNLCYVAATRAKAELVLVPAK